MAKTGRGGRRRNGDDRGRGGRDRPPARGGGERRRGDGPAARGGSARAHAPERGAGAGDGPGGARDSWLIRTAPGVGKVTEDELRDGGIVRAGRRPVTVWQRGHDLLFLQGPAHKPSTSRLRTAEEVHRLLIFGRYKVSESQLAAVSGALRAEGGAWRLAVSVDGEHFDRRHFRAWLERELADRRVDVRPDAATAQTLWVFAVDESYYVGLLQSSASDAPGRELRVEERPGSLPPTIAAAMARLGKPCDGETIVDPVAGSGTLLAEAHAIAPEAALVGFDIDPDAVAAARRNLRAAGARIDTADATAVDELAEGPVHLFLANLPFGKQFGDRRGNAHLYGQLLDRMEHLGAPGGWRAVLLTSDLDAIDAALERHPRLHVARALNVRVRGEQARIFVVRPAARR